jgi:Tol biopolymer transport system component
MKKTYFRILFLALVLLLLYPASGYAQYFGRNKPSYKKFKYDVLHTPHFEIYHYLKNDTFLNRFAAWTEEWYAMHQQIFKDTFPNKNPLILYTNHSDFQQTTAISGTIGTTTGGVTEALKNRVVMPVAPTLAQTDHVLGHELVHAFQFNRLLHSDSISGSSLNNIPLWMIEGMAEYFSIGSVDPHTAMWMRDALVNDDFPTLKQLSTESKYFPYRYGHAFWAMIGKTWGDSLIIPIFTQTARYGLDNALDSLLGFDSKTLSGLWKSAMETYYNKFIDDSATYIAGRKIISADNSGTMNLSPSLSPDGNYLAFFSEKDIFTLDLYLADAETGKIIKKLSSITRSHEIDDFSFNESAGTWSPDSKKFAFVVFQKGKNKLVIVDVERAKITDEIEFGNIASFSNPEWSPSGNYIAFSGLVQGIGDLYIYDTKNGNVKKLTDGFSSKIHPSWSPDGNFIVYVDEEVNSERKAKKFSTCLKIIDIRTKEIQKLDVFPGADNLNPRFSHDGKTIYFLSNADGFRNLFAYDLKSEKVFRLTRFKTGISGLTPYSPAMSAAIGKDLVAYTYYNKNSYEIYTASSADFQYVEVNKSNVDFEPGTLPPLNHNYSNIVDAALYNRWKKDLVLPPDSIREVPYRPQFKLDYISNTAGIGISTGGRYNTNNMEGSVSMIFSDIVGNNQLYSVLALNGEIYDFGGQIAYVNQTRKFNWGVTASHIPYRAGDMFFRRDTLSFRSKEDDEVYEVPVTDLVLDYIRMFEDNISFFTYHALSQTRRIEAGLSTSWYYYRIDRYHNYYDDLGFPVAYSKEKMPAPDGSNYQKIDLAYVTDNSYFGMTAPMRGQRARYQVEKYFGAVDFFTGLLDYRQYYFINPLTVAFRFYHYGRYGSGSETNLVSPIYLGYPWLIRGYENLSFYGSWSDNTVGFNSLNYSHLSGSRIAVFNAELRVPMTGPKRLALFGSKYFLTDLNLFFDGGLAWDAGDKPKITWRKAAFNQRVPVFSAGVSVRVNVLGYMVIEPYFAIPFQNGGWQNKNFGLNFVPGW